MSCDARIHASQLWHLHIPLHPPPPTGKGVSGKGFAATGVCGRQITGELVPDVLREDIPYASPGYKTRELSGLNGVMGERRSGLIRPWKRGPLARASAAAMSIETLLPDLEWLMKLVATVRPAVLGRLGVTANRPLGVRDKVGRGEEG
jgi:hypothetical protein